MIDPTLRQHYKRLFSVKPTIDTRTPKEFEIRRQKRSANVQKKRVAGSYQNISSSDYLEESDTHRIYFSDSNYGYESGGRNLDDIDPVRGSYKRINPPEDPIMVGAGEGMRRCNSISDKIDMFFDHVELKQQEAHKEYEQKMLARIRPPWYRSVSMQSSQGSRPPSRKASSRQSPSVISKRSSSLMQKNPLMCSNPVLYSNDSFKTPGQNTNIKLKRFPGPSPSGPIKPRHFPPKRPGTAPTSNKTKQNHGTQKPPSRSRSNSRTPANQPISKLPNSKSSSRNNLTVQGSRPNSNTSQINESRSNSKTSVNRNRPSTAVSRNRPQSNNSFIQHRKARPNSSIRPKSAAPNISAAESKLRQNRNYQPPRRKTKQMHEHAQQELIEGDEYEADFDHDSDEQDEEHLLPGDTDVEKEIIAQQREEWLMEQAMRGRARQRALMNRYDLNKERPIKSQHQRPLQEKESSKDSAYGYSGDSRMPTREPTPDNYVLISQSKRILSKSKPNPKRQQQTVKIMDGKKDAEYEKEKAYLDFLTDVTNDILTQGMYSDKAIRSAITFQMNKTAYSLTPREIENVLSRLKRELGLENGKLEHQSSIGHDSGLSDLLYTPKSPKRSTSKTLTASKKTLREIKEAKRTSEEILIDNMTEEDICDMLQEANLDSDTVNDILEIIAKDQESEKVSDTESTNSPKLFNSVNISRFNISFNAGKPKHSKSMTIQDRPSSGRKNLSALQRRARRQDSSSSNPDNSPGQHHPVPVVRRPPVPKRNTTSAPSTNKNTVQKQDIYSSPTPRSSSMYQPETDDEDEIDDEDEKKGSDDQRGDSDAVKNESGDKESEVEEDVDEESEEEDVEEEVKTEEETESDEESDDE